MTWDTWKMSNMGQDKKGEIKRQDNDIIRIVNKDYQWRETHGRCQSQAGSRPLADQALAFLQKLNLIKSNLI